MANDHDSGQTSEVLRLEADAAGIVISRIGATLVSSGTINRTSIVRSDDGSRYVLSEYRWPFDAPDDLDRPDKEASCRI
jgi:hypothetical protein